MDTICDIDFMGDERLRGLMTLLSFGVLVLGVVVALALVLAASVEAVDLGWMIALTLVSVIALAVHELVHAAAFKLLGGPSVRVTFGAQNGLIYTSAAGSVLTRPRFVCVACLAVGVPLLGWCLFALHLSGCAGDLIMAARIATERGCTHVRDTDYGCELLRAAGEPR